MDQMKDNIWWVKQWMVSENNQEHVGGSVS